MGSGGRPPVLCADLDLHHDRAAELVESLAGDHSVSLVAGRGVLYDVRRGIKGYLAIGPGPSLVAATAADLVTRLREALRHTMPKVADRKGKEFPLTPGASDLVLAEPTPTPTDAAALAVDTAALRQAMVSLSCVPASDYLGHLSHAVVLFPSHGEVELLVNGGQMSATATAPAEGTAPATQVVDRHVLATVLATGEGDTTMFTRLPGGATEIRYGAARAITGPCRLTPSETALRRVSAVDTDAPEVEHPYLEHITLASTRKALVALYKLHPDLVVRRKSRNVMTMDNTDVRVTFCHLEP